MNKKVHFLERIKNSFIQTQFFWHICKGKKQSKQFHDLQILRGFCYKEND